MESIVSHEDWKTCFTQLGPALLLFANNPAGRSAMPADRSREIRQGFPGVGGSLVDTLAQEESGYNLVEEGAVVEVGLDALEIRERQIVELRFFGGLTQSQIAAEVGISQMHVSRLLRQALQTMRGRLEEQTGVQSEYG